MWDTAARIGATLVEQHSPGLLADKEKVAPDWWRSYLGSDRGPETGLFLSLTPSRPGRGYGAGPAAVRKALPDSS